MLLWIALSFFVADSPLDARLSGLSYPYSVHEIELKEDSKKVTMAYMDVPPPEGAGKPVATVLLLHGKNFNASSWASTISALSAAGYRVIAPDQVGFGKSSKPRLYYRLADLAANTARLLDRLDISKVHVVGHSMGGMLAVRFARDFPKKALTLTLENPIGLEDYGKVIPPIDPERLVEQDRAQSVDAYREFFKKYFVTWRPEYEEWVRIRARTQAAADADVWAWASALTYKMIVEQPVRAELVKLRLPALLVIGQDDRTVVGRNLVPPKALAGYGNFPALGRAAARDLRGAELVEIPDCGHVPMFEAQASWTKALLDFLRRHP